MAEYPVKVPLYLFDDNINRIHQNTVNRNIRAITPVISTWQQHFDTICGEFGGRWVSTDGIFVDVPLYLEFPSECDAAKFLLKWG